VKSPEPPSHNAMADKRHAKLRKNLAKAGGIILCLVAGAWFLLGLAFIWIFASAGGAVGAFVSLVLAAIPPVALFLAWIRWGPWCNALRRIHWVCRRTIGATN
jgi:hypothetical protein